MNYPSRTDLFLIYALIPMIAILTLFLSKKYYTGKNPYHQPHQLSSQKYIVSRNLIISNILAGIAFLLVVIGLYAYIINFALISKLSWEIIALVLILLLSYPFSLGIGAHITSITLITVLPKELDKKNTPFIKALNFFHYPFSHKLPYASSLLVIYILTLLDLYKGKSLQLMIMPQFLSITTGIILGIIASFLYILSKCQSLMLKIVIILLVSIYLVATNESRNITEHPMSLLFTTFYWTIGLSLLIQKQTKLDVHTPAKKFLAYWFKLDIDSI